MNAEKTLYIGRRAFLASSSCMLLGAASLNASSLALQATPKGPDLSDRLSTEELELVKTSVMSEDMKNFWHKGYSCAETGLMVALRFQKKPEDLVWLAAGFAGGLGHQDLCGFLTSGVMAIGLHAGNLNMERSAAQARCGQLVNEYWTWWSNNAPLHCSEIRQGRGGFSVCERLGKLSTAKIESLIKA